MKNDYDKEDELKKIDQDFKHIPDDSKIDEAQFGSNFSMKTFENFVSHTAFVSLSLRGVERGH